MNYSKIYDRLIEKAKNRNIEGYYERHHIIPRCVGGSDDKENLVDLTPEEHYLAHQLLVKIYPDNLKLVKAASMMIPSRPNNKMYGWLRRRFSLVQSQEQSGNGNSQYSTRWITNGVEERKIHSTEKTPDNWFNGRLIAYKNRIKKQKEKQEQLKLKKEKLEEKVLELRKLFEIYNKQGFEAIQKLGYTFTQTNLTLQFKKYLPEFESQRGIKRK
jgi:hypothetical protein